MSARRIAIAVVLVVLAGCSRAPSREQIRTWDAEIATLQAEQDSLRQRAAQIVDKDPRIHRLPQGEVVISIPTSFVRTVVQQLFTQVASNVTLRLSGIKAHVAKKVKKVVTLGEFTVDVNVHEVVGRLRPNPPHVGFAGNRISMSLPVQVSEGTGRATVHFVWNGKNIADAACGDMDVMQPVSGSVIPARYVVAGRLDLALRDNQVVATPNFPETKVRIRVMPSKRSWAAVDSILESKRGVCGFVLDKVDVPSLLKGVVQERGFNVALPLSKLKPFTIPAGIQDSVRVGERIVGVATTTNTIRIDPDAILYGANVSLR